MADVREPAGCHACVRIADAHGAAVNCVRWHPHDERTLLSAASEPAARLWDLRSPGSPLHELGGALAAATARAVVLFAPVFSS